MADKNKTDVKYELKRNPINREKYVRDKTIYQSKVKAVRIQKPYLANQSAKDLAVKLEKEPIVQKLTKGIEEKIIELNAKRLVKLDEHMDSENGKISMEAVKEAGKVVEQYTDRIKGKAVQSMEVKSTKINISLDMSGGPAIKTAEVIEGETVEKELSDGNDS